MKKLLFSLVVVFIFSSFSSFAGNVMKLEKGNCNGSDPSKHFVSKTIVDVDDDGKCNYIVTLWCNGKKTVSQCTIVNINGTTNSTFSIQDK